MRDPAWLASHTQYGIGGVQNDPPKIRIGVQVLNSMSRLTESSRVCSVNVNTTSDIVLQHVVIVASQR